MGSTPPTLGQPNIDDKWEVNSGQQVAAVAARVMWRIVNDSEHNRQLSFSLVSVRDRPTLTLHGRNTIGFAAFSERSDGTGLPSLARMPGVTFGLMLLTDGLRSTSARKNAADFRLAPDHPWKGIPCVKD